MRHRPPHKRPCRIVVLISGAGTNMSALLTACQQASYGAQIVAVGSDRADASGLQLAREAGVETFIVPTVDHPTREAWDKALADRIMAAQPDIVVSAGFMRILGPEMLRRFPGKIVNTHPALLPAFPGAHGVRDALAYGIRVTGATLHVVDSGVDTGPIIAQVAVPVLPDDTVETLTERIKDVERKQLIEYVGRLAREGWTINDRKVHIP